MCTCLWSCLNCILLLEKQSPWTFSTEKSQKPKEIHSILETANPLILKGDREFQHELILGDLHHLDSIFQIFVS